MTSSHEKIDEALGALREVVSQVVREEQLRDQLTKLGNDHALTDWITVTMDRQVPFWIAFLEVDRFKEINDIFGYTNADTLLKRIAEQLTTASSFFPHGVAAFRAHGDEFYLARALVDGEEDEIAAALDLVRASIGQMRIRVEGAPRLMSCTMSVGWTTSREQARGGERGLRHNLEVATAAAKHRGRDRVLRYSDDLHKADVISLRATIPRSALSADGKVRCPNCGEPGERPAIASPGATPQPHPDI